MEIDCGRLSEQREAEVMCSLKSVVVKETLRTALATLVIVMIFCKSVLFVYFIFYFA